MSHSTHTIRNIQFTMPMEQDSYITYDDPPLSAVSDQEALKRLSVLDERLRRLEELDERLCQLKARHHPKTASSPSLSLPNTCDSDVQREPGSQRKFEHSNNNKHGNTLQNPVALEMEPMYNADSLSSPLRQILRQEIRSALQTSLPSIYDGMRPTPHADTAHLEAAWELPLSPKTMSQYTRIHPQNTVNRPKSRAFSVSELVDEALPQAPPYSSTKTPDSATPTAFLTDSRPQSGGSDVHDQAIMAARRVWGEPAAADGVSELACAGSAGRRGALRRVTLDINPVPPNEDPPKSPPAAPSSPAPSTFAAAAAAVAVAAAAAGRNLGDDGAAAAAPAQPGGHAPSARVHPRTYAARALETYLVVESRRAREAAAGDGEGPAAAPPGVDGGPRTLDEAAERTMPLFLGGFSQASPVRAKCFQMYRRHGCPSPPPATPLAVSAPWQCLHWQCPPHSTGSVRHTGSVRPPDSESFRWFVPVRSLDSLTTVAKLGL